MYLGVQGKAVSAGIPCRAGSVCVPLKAVGLTNLTRLLIFHIMAKNCHLLFVTASEFVTAGRFTPSGCTTSFKVTSSSNSQTGATIPRAGDTMGSFATTRAA